MHDEDCGLKHCPLNISEWETCFQLTTQLCILINVILIRTTLESSASFVAITVLSRLHIINKSPKFLQISALHPRDTLYQDNINLQTIRIIALTRFEYPISSSDRVRLVILKECCLHHY